MKVSVLAIVAGLAASGCNGPVTVAGPNDAAPARSTGAPFGVDQGEVETPNSLPVGDTTRNPVTSGEGVVGVLHLPSP